MTTQPEALRLADALDAVITPYSLESKAAAELRRLHAANLNLLAGLKSMLDAETVFDAEIAEEFARAAIAKAEGV
jgi:hypothetical protein